MAEESSRFCLGCGGWFARLPRGDKASSFAGFCGIIFVQLR